MRAAAPEKEIRRVLESEPLYEAERLRIIYQLITNPESEGGAGITPKEGEWKGVESIFPLHDHAYNKEWIKKWSKQYLLKPEDIDAIRDRLGEKVGLAIKALLPALLTAADRLLLCVHAVLFYLPPVPCCVRVLGMGAARPLLLPLCCGERPLVHHIHGVLETSRGRSCRALGCAWCLSYREQAQGLQA